jgi:hypothetical protein|tara:strand:- start:1225 stop:1404 length:180 start_codon:yes stop_codon:yes gene_type:complete
MELKEKFLAYEQVRQSGLTNMFHTAVVIELAEELTDIDLTREDIVDIMTNYSKYKKEFK